MTGLPTRRLRKSRRLRKPRRFRKPRKLLQILALTLCGAALTGCATAIPNTGSPFSFPAFTPQVQVSEAQACAIGYDLARAIHERVALRRVVILAPSRATPCVRHALEYLRQGGFRIDETGQGGISFDIALTRLDADTITAIALIGDDLRISRSYQPVRTGARAQGPVSVQHLNPDTYNLGRAFSKAPSDWQGQTGPRSRERGSPRGEPS